MGDMNLCSECDSKNYVYGARMTKYKCPNCNLTHTHHNTGIPKICFKCSEKNNRCQRCLKEIM